MRYLLSKAVPPFSKVLLVESGSRHLLENLLGGLNETYPAMSADLVTCYAGTPEKFRTEGSSVYRVSDYRTPDARKRLYAELAANGYDIIGIICSAEPIMTKWKWMLALKVPAKILVINENCDYFWLDRGHWSTIRHFVLFRLGLSGAGAVGTLLRLLLFPFTLLYLILYASSFHLRRKLRTL